jgi:glycosyltransferase involved in cell wall biosynthesis
MRVGTICYACHSGLGHLAKSFYDAGIVNCNCIVPHPHYPNHPEWYENEDRYSLSRSEEFLRNIDTLLIFENAFHWNIVRRAHHLGKYIVLMPMYEYTPYPFPGPIDLVLCPSLLDVEYYKEHKHTLLFVPCTIPWKLRTTAKTFIHNAGHGGRGYRNGTPELIEAMHLVKSPIELIIRGQPSEKRIKTLLSKHIEDSRIKVELREIEENEGLWEVGDVYIAPEKFNGLSLPLQEARSAGMVVMTTDRFPMNTWLPKEPLIPVKRYERDKIAVEFDRAVVTPEEIAKKIDDWYGRDISENSSECREWAKEFTWEALKPKYLEVLEPTYEHTVSYSMSK